MTSIAEVQQYWNSRPCNVRHSRAPIGSEAWSNEVTWRKYFIEPHIKEFAEFSLWRDKRVLEIGCGIGTDTLEFRKAGADIDAVDVSAHSLYLARKRSDAHFYCFNAEDRLPMGLYDLIYSFGVLHHTPHPERVLQGARRRMAPNGELRIMLYAKWSIKHLFSQQPEAQAGCPIAKFYTAREARNLLEGNGFKVQSIEKAHIFPWRISDYIEHNYVKEWYYRWMPKRLFAWLERRLGHHLLIVCR